MLDQFIQDVASDASIPDRVTALATIAALLVRVKQPTTRELYAAQLGGILKMDAQQVRRAMQEAAARPRPNAPVAAPAMPPPSAAPAVQGAKLPAEELQLVVLLSRFPELLRTPEAGRGGDLLIHPTLRQLHRAAAAQVSETGRLDLPALLDTVSGAERGAVAGAVMDPSLTDVADPPGLLRKLVNRLELLRVEAEIAMNGRLQREAQTRGDEEAARAHAVRGIELRKTKEGLLAALQRP
jgi:hypothetical protein